MAGHVAVWHQEGNLHLGEKGLGTTGLPPSVCVSRSLRGKDNRKRTLSDDLTSYCLTPGGKSGKKCGAFLGVTALSCPSRVHFGCLSDSGLFDEWLGEGRSPEDRELSD